MTPQLEMLHDICSRTSKNKNIKPRSLDLCEAFLGCKYGAWQDGTALESLDDFKYQLDLLDCVTYTEVVLALTITKPVVNIAGFINEFEKNLAKIHYANAVTNYKSRNHFMCSDWIPNNKAIIADVTESLSNSTKTATAIIDKSNWMRVKKDFVLEAPPEPCSLPYLDTEFLLNNYNDLITEFPEYCIVNIVRPNWDLKNTIGTHLNISHLGWAIKNSQNNEIDFYHASSEKMLVVKETLQSYMQRFKDSPTIRGINVQAIRAECSNAWQ